MHVHSVLHKLELSWETWAVSANALQSSAGKNLKILLTLEKWN